MYWKVGTGHQAEGHGGTACPRLSRRRGETEKHPPGHGSHLKGDCQPCVCTCAPSASCTCARCGQLPGPCWQVGVTCDSECPGLSSHRMSWRFGAPASYTVSNPAAVPVQLAFCWRQTLSSASIYIGNKCLESSISKFISKFRSFIQRSWLM